MWESGRDGGEAEREKRRERVDRTNHSVLTHTRTGTQTNRNECVIESMKQSNKTRKKKQETNSKKREREVRTADVDTTEGVETAAVQERENEREKYIKQTRQRLTVIESGAEEGVVFLYTSQHHNITARCMSHRNRYNRGGVTPHAAASARDESKRQREAAQPPVCSVVTE